MKPKDSVDPLQMANRSFDRASAWKGWGSIAFGLLVLLVGVTANSVWEQRRLPSVGLFVALFVLASLCAFAWFRSSVNLSAAYSACSAEHGKFGQDVSGFLNSFRPSKQEAEALLSLRAHKVKKACDAERLLYERGISSVDCEDPDRALELARRKYEAELSQTKSLVRDSLAEFWELHRLVQRFTNYELVTSWKPYAGMTVRYEGANEQPGQ